MIRTDEVPSATADPEDHADFLELCVFRSAGKSISVQELMRDLRIGNAAEALADSEDRQTFDHDDDVDEEIAQAAFDELDERIRNMGSDASVYPFKLSATTLSLRDDGDESLYAFLALLSWYGKDAGPANLDGEKIFEEVCAIAASAYFGGVPNGRVRSAVFGFPRRTLPTGFSAALDELCKSLGEGRGCQRTNRPTLPDQKDGKLDIVTWIEFCDRRQGKFIAFGQCATGQNWESKVLELPRPEAWCQLWMSEMPFVHPVRSFFVPHRVERGRWMQHCVYGGLLYDRCRIASLAIGADEAVRKQWVQWSTHVLQKIREV